MGRSVLWPRPRSESGAGNPRSDHKLANVTCRTSRNDQPRASSKTIRARRAHLAGRVFWGDSVQAFALVSADASINSECLPDDRLPKEADNDTILEQYLCRSILQYNKQPLPIFDVRSSPNRGVFRVPRRSDRSRFPGAASSRHIAGRAECYDSDRKRGVGRVEIHRRRRQSVS